MRGNFKVPYLNLLDNILTRDLWNNIFLKGKHEYFILHFRSWFGGFGGGALSYQISAHSENISSFLIRF